VSGPASGQQPADPSQPAGEVAAEELCDAVFAAADAGAVPVAGTGTDGPGAATITPYRDGPLIVRGDFRLLDTDGREIDPGRRTVALCRCGKSGIKPFCDGTHKRSGFSAGSAPDRPRPAARIRPAEPGTGDGATPG
jgi:CDGSH-type Zn-finger protein